MEEILKILLGILAGIVEGFSGGDLNGREDSKLLLFLWEMIGFIGGSMWLIVSLGRIRWENRDWRAMGTGMVLLGGGLMLVIRFGLIHYAATSAA